MRREALSVLSVTNIVMSKIWFFLGSLIRPSNFILHKVKNSVHMSYVHMYIKILSPWVKISGVYLASQKNSPLPPSKILPCFFVDFMRSFKLHYGILTCFLTFFFLLLFPSFFHEVLLQILPCFFNLDINCSPPPQGKGEMARIYIPVQDVERTTKMLLAEGSVKEMCLHQDNCQNINTDQGRFFYRN